MPLTMTKVGQSGCIEKIHAKTDIRRFLESLGFVVGEHVRVISEISGDLIVTIKGARFAINKSMASKIIVS
jgi:ferrous iron transport protein A